MPTLTKTTVENSSAQGIDARLVFTYEITTDSSDSYVSISNVKLQLQRTNIIFVGEQDKITGLCTYSIKLPLTGHILADNNTKNITLPNNNSWITVANLNVNINIGFGGNPIASVDIKANYEIPNTVLRSQSSISDIYIFYRPINDASTTNAEVVTWFPVSEGQKNASRDYNMILAMKANKSGYFYIKNDEDNKWYLIGSGSMAANTWIARNSGNGADPGSTSRIYSYHIDKDLINNGQPTTMSLSVDGRYCIPAPFTITNLIVGPSEKWRLGAITQNTNYLISRPSGIPTSYSGYTIVGNVPSFSDPATFKYTYLSKYFPASDLIHCPKKDSNNNDIEKYWLYSLIGFTTDSNSTSVDSLWRSPGTGSLYSTMFINPDEDIYAVFKKNATSNTIKYYVDGTQQGQTTRSITAAYYYGGGKTSGGVSTYDNNSTYTPSKTGYVFRGWCTKNNIFRIDYTTLKKALDANYDGNLYAIWGSTFSITTIPASSSNLGTVSGQIESTSSFSNQTNYNFSGCYPGDEYSLTINKNSNVSSYTVKIIEDNTVVSENRYTSNTTITGITISKDISIKIYWENNINFNYGASNGNNITVIGTVNNADRTEWTVTTPTKQADLTGSWSQTGWVPTVAASTTNKVNCNKSVTVTSTSYYALYSRILQFNSGEPDSTASYTRTQYRCGGTYSQPTTPTPEDLEGWNTKVGWRTDTTAATSATYNNATAITYTASSPLSFYALYSRPITFYYFSAANSTSKSTGTKTQYLNSGNSTPSSVSSYTLYTQSTYSWAPIGWRKDDLAKTNNSGLGQTGTTTISITPAYNSDDTVYRAVYRRTPQFTYNRNNGSSTPSATTASDYQYYNANNTTASNAYITTAAAITRTNYTFSGWALDSASGTPVYGASKSVKTPSITWSSQNSRVLYATWNRNTSAVTLDAQGGTGGTENVEATSGQAMPSITIPTYAGHTFLGYYDAETGGTKYYNANGSSAKNWDKTGAQTLYAHWQFRGMYVFRNGEWRKVVPYVYSSTYSAWKETIPYVYSSTYSDWKQA